ncbi:MAG: ABC transporter permease [Longimicrobiales bacterium]
MDSMLLDLKFALRSLARSPGFSALAVCTLALGIGAATAVFSVANGVLLRPLPYSEPDEVITVWASWDNFADKTWLSVQEYQLFHQENRALADLALYRIGSAIFTSAEAPEQVGAAFVTPNLFDVLGVQPSPGRAFTWEEARDADAGVLLAHATWLRRYGGDASLVGSTIEVDGRSHTLLGVLPEGFALPLDLAESSSTEVYYPFYVDLESPAPDLGTGGSHGSYGVGRLREGNTVEDARSDLARVMSQVTPVGLYSPERRFTPRVFGAEADVVGSARTTLLLLLGAVGLLLLIACGNVANLVLSRSEARGAEVAVRAALGASRARIARQLLTESAVLAGIAGILGVALAAVGVDALLTIDPAAVPRSGAVRMDARVFLFAVGVTAATALAFGLLPAMRVARSGAHATLRSGGRGVVGSSRIRGVLVASQMAMAVILLTGSGLLMRSFVRLLGVDTGFAAEDVLTLRVTAPASDYPDAPAVARLYEDLLRRIDGVPGVRAAAAVRLLPLASTMGDSFFRPVVYEAAPNEPTQGEWQWATPGYFEAMAIPLVEGRTIAETDRRDAQAVVVVNEAMARRYWGTESPLGRAVLASGALDTAIVVGVVADVRHNGVVTEAKPQYYVPHAQVHESMSGTMRGMTLTLATDGDPRDVVEPVRAAIRAFDPGLPVSQVMTLDEVLSRSVAQPRFALALLGGFGALALILALVGVYGVLSYIVGQRTREIGLRLALGAEAGQVIGMIVRQGLLMAVVGVTAGTAVSWAVGDILSGSLYEVTAQDPLTLASVPALFLLVAFVACWAPAVRASRVHPASALKSE